MERNDYCVILSAMVSQYFKFLSLAILHIIIVFLCVLFFKRCGMSVCMCFLVYLCQYIKMTQNLMIIIDN